jgi:hypothetical protein
MPTRSTVAGSGSPTGSARSSRKYPDAVEAGRLQIVGIDSDNPLATGCDVSEPLRQLRAIVADPRYRAARHGRELAA